jgi:hypothetical protein
MQTRQSWCGMQTLARHWGHLSEGTLTRLRLLQSHQMELTLCQVHLTRQFGYGMQRLARHWVHLSKGTLMLLCLLHSHQMELALCQVQMTRQFGCGMQRLARHWVQIFKGTLAQFSPSLSLSHQMGLMLCLVHPTQQISCMLLHPPTSSKPSFMHLPYVFHPIQSMLFLLSHHLAWILALHCQPPSQVSFQLRRDGLH